jgi:hypothetical protein
MQPEHRLVACTETNTHARVPVCSCGWHGAVHVCPIVHIHHKSGELGPDFRRLPEKAIEAAQREWYEHCRIEAQRGPLTATRIIDPADYAHLVIPKR